MTISAAGRLGGPRVRINRGNFRNSDFHAVASRCLSRVERCVGLLKKLFQRQETPFWAQQEPEAHRNWNGTTGRLHGDFRKESSKRKLSEKANQRRCFAGWQNLGRPISRTREIRQIMALCDIRAG